MESYKKHLADSTKILMVHLSYDEEPAEALAWARKENFPWLTVPNDKAEAAGLEQYSEGFVPEYVLLNPAGEVLVRGKDEVFKKIEELNG